MSRYPAANPAPACAGWRRQHPLSVCLTREDRRSGALQPLFVRDILDIRQPINAVYYRNTAVSARIASCSSTSASIARRRVVPRLTCVMDGGDTRLCQCLADSRAFQSFGGDIARVDRQRRLMQALQRGTLRIRALLKS